MSTLRIAEFSASGAKLTFKAKDGIFRNSEKNIDVYIYMDENGKLVLSYCGTVGKQLEPKLIAANIVEINIKNQEK